jgi:hypothetical protein
MRYYKRLKQFKSKRCKFDLNEMSAYSYNWWKFVECRNGRVYFNDATYSMQTGVQQYIIKNLLNCLGIKYTIKYYKLGLNNLIEEINRIKSEIYSIQLKIDNPKSHKKTNEKRIKWIKHLKNQIKDVKKYSKMRITEYKGRINLKNIPKPVPLSENEKIHRNAKRIANKTGRDYSEVYNELKFNVDIKKLLNY